MTSAPSHDRTHYDVLGIAPTAAASEVRAAWRLHVQAWHPDRFADDAKDVAEAHTTRINEAYSVLRDSGRRAAYDCALAADRLAARSANDTDAPTRAPRRNAQAPVGSPFEETERAEAPSPTLSGQLDDAGRLALTTLRRHPRAVAAVAAVWAALMVGAIATHVLAAPRPLSQLPPVARVAAHASPSPSEATPAADAVDLDSLAQQAQRDSAADDALIAQMQADEAARQAAQDAADARAAAADAAALQRAQRRGANTAQSSHVVRVLPQH